MTWTVDCNTSWLFVWPVCGILFDRGAVRAMTHRRGTNQTFSADCVHYSPAFVSLFRPGKLAALSLTIPVSVGTAAVTLGTFCNTAFGLDVALIYRINACGEAPGAIAPAMFLWRPPCSAKLGSGRKSCGRLPLLRGVLNDANLNSACCARGEANALFETGGQS